MNLKNCPIALFLPLLPLLPLVGCADSFSPDSPVAVEQSIDSKTKEQAFEQRSLAIREKLAARDLEELDAWWRRINLYDPHVLDYDPLTGEAIAKVTFQGYADSSMWARGQAWATYGYTMAYRETRDPAFLRQAIGAADMFINRLPEDVVPYWDFDAPKTADPPKDASSAAIAASAFLELSQLVDSQEQHLHYYNAAIRLLNELSQPKYLADEENYQGILLHSTGHFPRNSEVDVHLIYADYYFLEALYRLKQLDRS